MADRWQRLERLFAEAAELDPARREPFLRQACGEDRELLSEILELLAADSSSAGDRFITGAIAGVIGESPDSLAATRIGHQVGPYRLLRELGHGGMGTVYLANRIDDAYRAEVAIKFVQGGLANPRFHERFRTERQILADLAHPNIARLLDGGTAEDGTPFLVMERVNGEPISRYCQLHHLSLDDRLRLLLKVAAAVQYAHQALVVHRDLKPSNILVTPEGEPKLLDFGIARLQTEESPAETTGLRLMTPAFASPEQVRGERITVSADVYSLGAVIYLVLTGTEVFDLKGLSAAAVERRISDEDPTPPSRALAESGGSPERIRALAGDIDTIVLKALRKEPSERYPSVAALAEDIRRYLNGEPVLARRSTVGYRLQKLLRRHRVGFTTAAAILLSLGGVVGFYTHRVSRERDRAQLEAAKADEVAQFLRGLFEVSDPSRSRGETVTARELLDQGAERIRGELTGQPEVQATMMRVIGEVYQGLGLSEQARPLLQQALEEHERLYSPPNEAIAASQTAYAVVLQDLGDLAAAEPLFRQALAMRTRLYGPEHERVSESLSHLAYLIETTGDEVQAESLLRQALNLNRRLHPAGHPTVAASLVRLGGLLRRMDRPGEAEPLLREGLAAQRALYGERDLAVASTARNLAALLRDKGEFAESERLYLEVLATRRALLGENHPDVAITLNSYALLLQEKGDVDSAISLFQEFIRLLDNIYSQPHPSQAAAYNNLAHTYKELARYDEAERMFRRSIQVQNRILPPGHPNRAHPLLGLAGIRMAQKRYAEAELWYRQVVDLRRKALPAGHRDTGEALSELGASLFARRKFPAAEAALLESHAILLAADGASNPRTRRVAQELVSLYEAWERLDQAQRYRLEAVPPTPAPVPPS